MTKTKDQGILNIGAVIEKLNLEENSKVADFGCGRYGYFVFPLTKIIGPQGQIYAIDIIKENLNNIKKRAYLENLEQVKTIWSDLEVLGGTKIKDESLDAVLIINTLYQSNKYVEILKEAKRVLKSDGELMIVDWDKEEPFLNINLSNNLDKKDLLKTLQDLKLVIKEDFSAGKYHYGLLLGK